MSNVDEAKLEKMMEKLVGIMTGAVMASGIQLGDELGLYRAMKDAGPLAANEVARRTKCNPRLVREWLDGQAAMGLIEYDSNVDTYLLSSEAALPLADDAAPMFVARAMSTIQSTFIDQDKIAKAFRGDGGLAWGDHDACLFKGTEWFFRPGYRAFLTNEWIPALDGLAAKLKAGARIADVGCGHGASAVVMAQAYPDAHVVGFDYHEPSIETSKQRAKEAGVTDRCEFVVADAKSYDGEFDLICFFDCLHDTGDPVGIARHAREHLTSDGAVLLVEPFAKDGRAANMAENPLAAMLYTVSSMVCTPNSLSQEVKLGLGAQAGEARLREVFEQAGFERFKRVAETPFNLIIEARV
jgi:2-polyprenyl-3-methyl-5-hydroxy-6-metoxy-1,4-benzoquinol methylase